MRRHVSCTIRCHRLFCRSPTWPLSQEVTGGAGTFRSSRCACSTGNTDRAAKVRSVKATNAKTPLPSQVSVIVIVEQDLLRFKAWRFQRRCIGWCVPLWRMTFLGRCPLRISFEKAVELQAKVTLQTSTWRQRIAALQI